MIHWYRHLYMDETVARRPKHCKSSVEAGRLWKRNYFVVILAVNEANLFEIMGTRQLFFRHYKRTDLYVLGLAVSQDGAERLLLRMIEDVCREDKEFYPRKYFLKKDFSN